VQEKQAKRACGRATFVGKDGLEEKGEPGVMGDLLGRKLTASVAARRQDASADCSRCTQQVPTSDALVCCFREKDIVFPKGRSGGQCGVVLCVECFNDDIDEEQYPDWRDEP
jgi:hypothetical protein